MEIKFDKEQRFIVTGASSGIGENTALMLNKLGATVIAIGRNKERLQMLVEQSYSPENMFTEQKDLTEDIPSLPQYVKSLKDKYGKFQGLVYCAGIGKVEPLQMIQYPEVIKEFETNYFAPLFLAKGFADRRINNGSGSTCVFVSSIASFCSDKGHVVYAGSKAALSASVKSMAKELAKNGVRMNCVSPSAVNTPMLDEHSRSEKQMEKYPFGIADTDDVSNLIIYLLSDKAKFISAQNYIIDSGGVS